MEKRHPPDRDAGPPKHAPTPEALAGWCEAASRVLGPLLASQQVKARIRVVLQHVDPDYAPVLVRTLLRTDPELPLAALSALPRLANAAIEGVAELGRALGAYPPALLGSIVAGLVAELRPRPLGEALGRAVRVASALPLGNGDPAAFWAELARGFHEGYGARSQDDSETGPGALGAHAQGLASFLGTLAKTHPELVTSMAASLKNALHTDPALVKQGLVPLLRPLLRPLHEALHEASSDFPEDASDASNPSSRGAP